MHSYNRSREGLFSPLRQIDWREICQKCNQGSKHCSWKCHNLLKLNCLITLLTISHWLCLVHPKILVGETSSFDWKKPHPPFFSITRILPIEDLFTLVKDNKTFKHPSSKSLRLKIFAIASSLSSDATWMDSSSFCV